MRNFMQLEFWHRGHQLTLKIYKATQSFPKEEMFGLTSQMRRAAMSIPSNIAEGCGREINAELKRFLAIAAGSSSELQYQILLSKDLSHIGEELYRELNEEIVAIRKLIFKYSEKL